MTMKEEYTAHDMATAAAEGFRDGQRASAELAAQLSRSMSEAMTDLPKRLRIKASMIALGERIAWGSDTALMEEAADVIEALSASVENHQLHMLGMARDRDQLLDQLRATLAAQPQAAPDEAAGEVQQKTVGRTSLLHVELAQPLPPGTKLYSHPAPSQPSGRVPELSGIGRDADHPRALVLYLREEPTDETIRAVQEALRNATQHPEQPQASAAQSAPAGEREAFELASVDDSFGSLRALGAEAERRGIEDGDYIDFAARKAWEYFKAGAAWQRTQSAGVPEGWRAHSVRFARGVKCPQSIETLQAAWDRDQELILEQKAEISRLKEKLNQARQRHPATAPAGCKLVPVVMPSQCTDKAQHVKYRNGWNSCLSAVARLNPAPAQPTAHDQGEAQRLREALECVKQAGFDCGNDGWGVIHMTIDDWQIVLAALAASTGQEVE